MKFIEVAKEWMHGCVMENVRKIKIKLENIWIDLIRSIYAPYRNPMSELKHATESMVDFHLANPDKPGPSFP